METSLKSEANQEKQSDARVVIANKNKKVFTGKSHIEIYHIHNF